MAVHVVVAQNQIRDKFPVRYTSLLHGFLIIGQKLVGALVDGSENITLIQTCLLEDSDEVNQLLSVELIELLTESLNKVVEEQAFGVGRAQDLQEVEEVLLSESELGKDRSVAFDILVNDLLIKFAVKSNVSLCSVAVFLDDVSSGDGRAIILINVLEHLLDVVHGLWTPVTIWDNGTGDTQDAPEKFVLNVWLINQHFEHDAEIALNEFVGDWVWWDFLVWLGNSQLSIPVVGVFKYICIAHLVDSITQIP